MLPPGGAMQQYLIKAARALPVGRFLNKDNKAVGLGADQGQSWIRPLTFRIKCTSTIALLW